MVQDSGATRQFRKNVIGQVRVFVDHELTVLGLSASGMQDTLHN
jgi:hypothetical protein